MSQTRKVGVIGAGMMGSDISLACGLAGYEVFMKDMNMSLAEAGYKKIVSDLDKWISKERIQLDEAGKKRTLGAIKPTGTFKEFKDVDIVIEAINGFDYY